MEKNFFLKKLTVLKTDTGDLARIC